MNNTNGRTADAALAVTYDITSAANAPSALQWPSIERRKADRRRTDRRHEASPADPLANDASGCTGRELQNVRLLLQGMTNKQIAHALGIAEDTVKKHLQRAYKKLGVRRRALLIVERASAIKPRRTSTPFVE